MKGEPGELKKGRMAGEQKEWAMAGRKTAWRRRVWLRKRDGEGAEGRGGARNDGPQVRVAGRGLRSVLWYRFLRLRLIRGFSRSDEAKPIPGDPRPARVFTGAVPSLVRENVRGSMRKRARIMCDVQSKIKSCYAVPSGDEAGSLENRISIIHVEYNKVTKFYHIQLK
ncbi:hypothetical protein B0H14DRAFT_2567412 [Mycena olivaceomarginata]|nr:hypothetical protein B0H14DRAFT_2567412 [Mycena olivaceomarginata]